MTASRPWDPIRFASMPLIAISRGQREESIRPVVEALVNGGFTALEITMNTPGATAQIQAAILAAENRLDVGAGTVTSRVELEEAESAGARFIVTPGVDAEVIGTCVRRNLPVFAGAFTPTEVHLAHRLGAFMVKLFPANRLGPDYFRDLKSPFSNVRLFATGGITPESMSGYRRAGAEGFGVGTPLLAPDRIAAGDWAWLQRRAREFCAAWRASQA